jgi:hypothetical protein
MSQVMQIKRNVGLRCGAKKRNPTYTAHGHKLNFFNKVGGQEKDFFEVLVFLKKKLKPRNHPTKSSPKKV